MSLVQFVLLDEKDCLCRYLVFLDIYVNGRKICLSRNLFLQSYILFYSVTFTIVFKILVAFSFPQIKQNQRKLLKISGFRLELTSSKEFFITLKKEQAKILSELKRTQHAEKQDKENKFLYAMPSKT